MIPYRQIAGAQDEVLHALERQGGSLSPAALILSTQMAYDVVAWAVRELAQKGQVEVRENLESEIELVQLARPQRPAGAPKAKPAMGSTARSS